MCLRGMGAQGCALGVHHGSHVHAMRNVVRRRPRPIEFLRIETGRHEAQGGGRVRPPANHFAWQGRLEEACVSRRPGTAHGPVHLLVVRVAIPPGRVVTHQDVGIPRDIGDAFGNHVNVDSGESRSVLGM